MSIIRIDIMKRTNIEINRRAGGRSDCPIRRYAGILLVLVASFLCSQRAGAEEIFAALTDMNQVESTYISGRFAHHMKTWRSANGNHAMNLSQGFSSLYSYQCYSLDAVDKARKILKDYLQKHPELEVVMRSKDAAGEYVVYESFIDDNTVSKMIIWNSDAPNVCEIVVIDWKKGLARGSSKYSDSVSDAPQTKAPVESLRDITVFSTLEGLLEGCREMLSDRERAKVISPISIVPSMEISN